MKQIAAIILGIALCGGVAHAYTAAERQNCEADARRLCSAGQLVEAALGNIGGVVACFNAHPKQLSRACAESIRAAHGGKR